MLKIELITPQGLKVFTQDFIPGRMYRKTIVLQKQISAGVDENVMDKMVALVVDIFAGQFTIDEFYDGVHASKMMNVITGCINAISGKASEAVGVDESDPNL